MQTNKKIKLPEGNGKTTQEAMEWIKSLAIKGGEPVPEDEDGRDCRIEADDPETARQKTYVKESLYRALGEVERAKKGEVKLQTEEDFWAELKTKGYL